MAPACNVSARNSKISWNSTLGCRVRPSNREKNDQVNYIETCNRKKKYTNTMIRTAELNADDDKTLPLPFKTGYQIVNFVLENGI